MNRIISRVEEFIWANLRFYLLTYPTCLLDLILEVDNPSADVPIVRYKDLMNDLGKHMGLGSYTNTQPTQFSAVPYITVNIAPIPLGYCSTRAVVSFDVVFATDVPKPSPGSSTRYVGNSSESVAKFRAEVVDALCQLFFRAYGDEDMNNSDEETPADHYEDRPFWEPLYFATVKNPLKSEDEKVWDYNIRGQVDDEYTVSEVTQLKREDRSSGLSVFSVTFTMDINRLQGNGIDCGC